jgi:hypothetical protein
VQHANIDSAAPCLCVPAGQTGLQHAVVLKVERLENAQLWAAYAGRKKSLMAACQLAAFPQPDPRICQQNWSELYINQCDMAINEACLFHGVPHGRLAEIMEQGLDQRVARETGMYGAGIYFAENSCKSHAYTEADADGVHCMLYCRVALGRTVSTKQTLEGMPRPAFEEPDESGLLMRTVLYDSVIAPTGAMENHQHGYQVHREFIVFDRTQVYPEFCIYYRPAPGG